jgi:acyl-CoA synthetase (AMP-forming)/AMP-acid ligase II
MLEMTIDYFLRRALQRHAERVAIVDDERNITYADLDRRSNAIAAYLLEQRLRKLDRVAVLLHNRAEFIETELGIIKAGLVKVPINNKLSTNEIVAILKDSGARALVLEPEFQAPLLNLRGEMPELRLFLSHEPSAADVVDLRSIADRTATQAPPSTALPSDLYLLRYSGGTTGQPKGIMHSHASATAIAISVIREYGLETEDHFLHAAHLSHGQNFVWPGLLGQGAKLVMMRRFDPLAVLQAVQRERITRLHLVPTMMAAVFDHPRVDEFDLSSLNAIVYASAPMATTQIKRLYDRFGARISQTYTLSESAVITTSLTPQDHVCDGSDEQVARLASCGREVLDVELRIVNDEMTEVPCDVVGEIAIRSPGNMMGYWNQPELTASVLRDGWVLSGDLGRKDSAGYVFLVDRKDDKIITGGFNVYPREVEEALYRHPAIREAAVVASPDEKWGEAITAVVALHTGRKASEEELLAFCADHLTAYKKPKRVIICDELPKSAVGKILRRVVREPFWSGKARRIN